MESTGAPDHQKKTNMAERSLKQTHNAANSFYDEESFNCLLAKMFEEIYLIHTREKLKVVTSEKIGGSGVTSTIGTWYGGVVLGVLLSCNEAAILYTDFNSAPSQKQNIIVFAANNSRCCECYVEPTIIL